MTKTLILPAEIYAREFDARLLHGVIALNRGWRVIVGSKALINRAIWKLPRGVYLCQTMTHKRRTMLKLLRRLGFVCVGWDEEGFIYLDRDVYLMRRISLDTLKHLDSVIAWGRQGAEDVGHRSRTIGLEPLPLGNPRFDLARRELHALYADEVAAIRAQHGRFVLINTNFPSLNPIVSLHDQKPRITSSKHPPSEKELQRFARFQEHRRALLSGFLEGLPQLARKLPDIRFVMRAHPGENEEVWKSAFAGLSNVSVIREGSSVPWLIAADALIHNGCTTAVEAAVIGLTPIAYCPETSPGEESAVPNPISYRAHSLDDLEVALRRSAARTLPMGNEQTEILSRHLSAVEGDLASIAIMNHFDGLDSERPDTGFLTLIFYRTYAMLRHAYKAMRRGHLTDRYLAKVFPQVSAGQVSARANQIANALSLPENIRVRSISRNVFELTAKDAPLQS
jgi:surface carbohydrate biosynthesis protein